MVSGWAVNSNFSQSDSVLLLFGDLTDWNSLVIVVFMWVAMFLCILLSTIAQTLARHVAQDVEKRSTYECGFSPYDSASRSPFDAHYYVVGIMFLVFDVEVSLIFPFARCAGELEWFAYANMGLFVCVLTAGYVYEWIRGALLWAVKLSPQVPKNSAFYAYSW